MDRLTTEFPNNIQEMINHNKEVWGVGLQLGLVKGKATDE